MRLILDPAEEAAHRDWLRRVITRTFTPDALIRGLAPLYGDQEAAIGGFHLYTFNELERTERWRRGMIERLRREVG